MTANKPGNNQPTLTGTSSDQDIFISHSWSNKVHVTAVKKFLEENGISCWIDDKQLYGGMKLLSEIATAVRNSKVFIPFMSKKFIESENCSKEINYANTIEKTIIPVIIEDIRPKADLISSKGKDFLIYFSEDLYVKIIVTDPLNFAMNAKLKELVKSAPICLAQKEDNTDS